MARPRLPYERERLRLDGYLPKDHPVLLKIKALPARTRFPTVVRWLEMGKVLEDVKPTTPDDEILRMVREAEAASQAFFDRFDDE